MAQPTRGSISTPLIELGPTVLPSFALSTGGQAVVGGKVVKAVPPFAEVLHSPSTRISGERPGVFVCGNDPAARATILKLVSDIDADGVDAGPLSLARYTEPLGMLLVQLAYLQGFGARIGTVLIRDQTKRFDDPAMPSPIQEGRRPRRPK